MEVQKRVERRISRVDISIPNRGKLLLLPCVNLWRSPEYIAK
jgi:hypothetical protein